MNEEQSDELNSVRERIAQLSAKIEQLELDNERLRAEIVSSDTWADQKDLLRWRSAALTGWTTDLTGVERVRELAAKYDEVGQATRLRALEIDRLDDELAAARNELAAMKASLSWHITSPLRKVRRKVQ